MEGSLADQQQMLNVMPELDHQSNGPPFPGGPGKSFSQNPDANQHDERIAIVQNFRVDQPGEVQPKKATGMMGRPAKDIDLPGLGNMLRPMRQHDNHKGPERSFVPTGVDLFIKAHLGGDGMYGSAGR